MNNLSVRQGGQLDLRFEQLEGSDATSVTFLMRNQETDVVYSVNADYVDGFADITLDSDQTSIVGVYDWQLNENIPGEDPLIYPNPDNCAGGDCGFPTLTVCESIVIS